METHDLLCAEQLLGEGIETLVKTGQWTASRHASLGQPSKSPPTTPRGSTRTTRSRPCSTRADPIPSRFNLMVDLERQRDELVRPREAPKKLTPFTVWLRREAHAFETHETQSRGRDVQVRWW